MRWYEQVFKSIGKLDLIYEIADWYTTPNYVPVMCRTKSAHTDKKDIPFWNTVEQMFTSSGKLHPFLDLQSINDLKSPTTNSKCVIS